MTDSDSEWGYDDHTQQAGNKLRIEFTDNLVRAFCERRTDQAYPWGDDLHRPLMMRLQGLAAATSAADVFALTSMGFVPSSGGGGSVRVAGGYRLQIKISDDAPLTVCIQGLATATPTGDRNA